MGIRKTLLIASTALIVPLAAQASPFGTNTHQGNTPVAQQGLYQEANSMKDFWDELGEGGDKSRYDCDEECGDEEGERDHRNWNKHGQWSWRDDDNNNDNDRGNWWNESGHSGQHNWWNESGESGDHGKKKGWKKNNHHDDHDDHGEHGENGWWDND